MKWQPIETAPYGEIIDLWCVSGDEDVCAWHNGAPVGGIAHKRSRSRKYGWMGNQSNEGVPNGNAKDLVPVAWIRPHPDCPVELIAKATGWPFRESVDGESP